MPDRQGHSRDPRELCARVRLRSAVLAALAAMMARGTLANPTGGQVVGGAASITTSGKRLDVAQTSDRAIIDWRTFDIARNEQTRFNQPSNTSVALNRVTGGQQSRIDGTLTANGRVFLINPGGTIFGADAKVSVGGLVATTADVKNEDFLAGRDKFAEAGQSGAKVVNEGEITVTDGGAVVLAAPVVRNEGVITARLGSVQLAGTNTFTVDFEGTGLLSFAVEEAVSDVPSATEALVANSGKISADGGVVAMTANAAGAVLDRVISMDGIVQARSVSMENGTIVLSGGEHGIVEVSGTLDAAGDGANERGGHIAVLGERVGLYEGAHITASGQAGGGEVLVGGNFQGKGPEYNASRTYVDPDAHIEADARVAGNGGRVVVWADEGTQYYGEISARGGAQGGDGGFVEVSGKDRLDFRGGVDVGADTGAAGTVLLDPDNIRICDDVGACPGAIDDPTDPIISDGFVAFDDDAGADFFFTDEALEALTGNIILQATNDIDVDTDLLLVNQEAGERVVFQAGDQIDINASITTMGASITLEADSPHIDPDGVGDIFFFNGFLNSGGGNITLIGAAPPNFDGGLVTAISGDIDIGPSLPGLIFALPTNGSLARISTTGLMTTGRALSAGSNGLGLGAVELTVDDLNFTGGAALGTGATDNLFLALDDVLLQSTSGDAFAGTNESLEIRAGGDVTLDNISLPQGRFLAEAGAFALGGTSGTLSLGVTTTDGDVELVAPTVLLIGSIDANTGGLAITTDDLQYDSALGAQDILGEGVLTIQPLTPTRDISISDAPTGAPDQLNIALQFFQPTFNEFVFGRADATGNDLLVGDPAVQTLFNTEVTLVNPDGDIFVNGDIFTNAPLTFAGAGLTTIGGLITTSGQDITFENAVALRAATTIDTVTTAGPDGADITFQQSVTGNGFDLSLDSGTLGLISATSLSDLGIFTILNSASSAIAEAVLADELNLVDTVGDITFDGAVDADVLTTGGAYTLRLNGGGQVGAAGGGPVTFANTGGVFINDNALDTMIVDGGVTAAGTLNVAGTIAASGALNIGALVLETDTTIDTSSAAGANDINFGEVTANGFDLTLDTGGVGDVSAVATGNFANDFATLLLDADDVTLTESNDIVFGASTVNGQLSVTAVGDITSSGAIAVAGASAFVSGADIDLVDGNDFLGAVTLTAVGDVAIADINDITLAAAAFPGLLSVSAGGDIATAGALTVAGDSVFDAGGSIVLDDAANDFGDSVALTAGADATIFDAGDLELATSNVNGALDVTAGGDITESGALVVGDTSAFDAGGVITLTNAANDFNGAVTLTSGADALIADADALVLAASGVAGAFDVTAGGNISTIGALTVGGASTFDAGGAITLADEANDFTGAVTFAAGADVTISDANTLILAGPSAGGAALTFRASDVTITGAIAGSGTIAFEPLDLAQDMVIGDGDGTFALTNADLANLTDGFDSISFGRAGYVGGLLLDGVTLSDPLTVQADGPGASITITNGLTLLGDGSVTLNGSGSTTFLDGLISTQGGDIVINDNVELTDDAALDTTGGGAVLPGGDITINGSLLGPTFALTVSGGFWTAPDVDVLALNMNAVGLGAAVNGNVAGDGGLIAAENVNVLGNVDPDFLINGCVMGIACEGQEIHIDPPVLGDFAPTLEVDLPLVWDTSRTLVDPRDVQYSNLGNEELWWNGASQGEEETP